MLAVVARKYIYHCRGLLAHWQQVTDRGVTTNSPPCKSCKTWS